MNTNLKKGVHIPKILKSALIVFILSSLVSVQLNAQKWYDGGTLHNSSIIEWKDSTDENKLATCADWIASLWINSFFNSDISSMLLLDYDKSLKDLSIGLKNGIDYVAKNTRSGELIGKKAREIGALVMQSAGWVK